MGKPKGEGSIGFKDLWVFNMAFIAQQSWHIMTQTSTLLHQVFKAKYFPHSNFMGARIGPSPSYTWRGILEAWRIIREGSRWRVGNGKAINIWADCWLPGHKNLDWHRPLGEAPDLVESLIDQQTRYWNVALVQKLFPPKIAADVFKMMRCFGGGKEGSLWCKECLPVVQTIGTKQCSWRKL